MGRTQTNRTDRKRRDRTRVGPHIVRLLDYERPRVAGSRHALVDVTEVAIGRGDAAGASRQKSRLELVIADKRMSQTHARITRDGAGWTIEDLGSRNGTFVDGKRIERSALRDGAAIELGRTALWFGSGTLDDKLDVTAGDVGEALPGITTFSVAFARRLEDVAKLAKSSQSLVLHGETGTGKEVVARGVHAASKRTGPFVAVNCGALPANLIESELFGFRKGAFSGAIEDRPGLIRSAHGGTLFLDEIGDLPAPTQAALLRVLQEHEVMPIGASKPVEVDIRVIAASHRDLEAAVEAEAFREDLLARLSGFVLEIPALRDRREDLGLLIASLLGDANVRFAPEAGFALVRYGWPRNVRELEQALSTAVALAQDGVIELEHLPPSLAGDSEEVAEDLSPSEARRRDELRTLLATHKGNVAAVARAMSVARMQIHRWLERYKIALDDYRK